MKPHNTLYKFTPVIIAIVILYPATILQAQISNYDADFDVIELTKNNSPYYQGEEFPKNGSELTMLKSAEHGFFETTYYLPGFDGNILASAEHEGELYIGGWFTRFNDGVTLNGVAKWNGSDWEPVGQGFRNFGGIASISVLYSFNGDLYAGGIFNESGGTEVNNIARWNGTKWQPLGEGFNGTVRTIIEFNNDIYAGGSFTFSGETEIMRIAKWNGTEWEAVDRGLDGPVFALEVWDGRLVAAGQFIGEPALPLDDNSFVGEYSVTQETQSQAIIWTSQFISGDDNGWLWNSQTEPQTFTINLTVDPSNPLNGRVFEATAFEAWGPWPREWKLKFSDFITLDGHHTTGLNCSSGSFTYGPAIDETGSYNPEDDSSFEFFVTVDSMDDCDQIEPDIKFTAVKTSSSSNLAASNTQTFNRIASYDGNNWSGFDEGFSSTVTSLANVDGQLYAGGHFNQSGEISVNGIAKWGEGWEPLGDGLNGPVLSMVVDGSTLFASGVFSESGTTELNRVASWDGTAWQNLVSEEVGSAIFHIGKSSGSIFGVLGSFNAGDLIEAALLSEDNWDRLGTPDSDGAGVAEQVAGLAKDGTTLYASGNFLRAGLVPAMRTAKWTPQEGWQQLGSGLNNFARRMTLFDDMLIVGGNFSGNGAGDPIAHIAYFDGTDWAQMGSGLNGTIQRFFEYNGDLIVAGNFVNSGPNEVTGITKWDGNDWQTIGDGIVNAGFGLGELDGDLYLSGYNLMGNNEKITKWDGSEWTAIPLTGVVQSVDNVISLGVHDSSLYASFEIPEDNGSQNIYRLNDSEWEQIGDPMYGGWVFDIVSHDDQLYVGGHFNMVGEKSMRTPAIWNGSEWKSADGGINGIMHSFVTTPRGIYIGGNYTTAGTVPSRSIAKWITDADAVSIDERIIQNPRVVSLHQNYPNPFNPSTIISFELPVTSDVRLDVYNMLGQRVATLVNGQVTSGTHEVSFNASNLSSGMYFYRLQTPEFTQSRSMMLIK